MRKCAQKCGNNVKICKCENVRKNVVINVKICKCENVEMCW
jgi:hypothetical protein